jgi:hypothetical protein
VSTFGVYDRAKITDSVVRETHPIGGHNLYTVTKICSEHLVHSYAEQYKLDCIIIRPSGVFGRGHYVGGSTVGKVMRDLALNTIKGEPFTIDAKIYGPNEYVYGKDVGLALFLACQAQNPKQRIYNAGSGVVTGPDMLAQTVRELAPQTEVKVAGATGTPSDKSAPLENRARLHTAVSAKRGLAQLHGRVVGRTKKLARIVQQRRASPPERTPRKQRVPSIRQPKPNHIIQRRHTVLPSDFLAFLVGAAIIGDRYFVKAAAFFGQFHGDLGLEAEALRLELDAF